MKPPTIKNACDAFLGNIKKSMPLNTYKNYRSDLLGSSGFVLSAGLLHAPISALTEAMGVSFIQTLLDHGASPATRLRRASALREFFRFASEEYDIPISVDRFNYKMKSRKLLSKVGSETPYPAENIQRILDYTKTIKPQDLTMRRDLAFIWSLAETGMRVSEACNLKIGQIDKKWNVTFIGKGDVKRTVFLGSHSRALITSYLASRKPFDESTGRFRDMLPLFARHDSTVGKNKIKPISHKIGEGIIHNLALLALGKEYDPSITCHKFRHYYISSVLHVKGFRAAQIGAGHKRSSTTERYAHLSAEEIANINSDVFG